MAKAPSKKASAKHADVGERVPVGPSVTAPVTASPEAAPVEPAPVKKPFHVTTNGPKPHFNDLIKAAERQRAIRGVNEHQAAQRAIDRAFGKRLPNKFIVVK